ncbi:hypothetical protein L226DRAFT_524652 [Lentinus tigrinus ALCF2SS1-7]|uniref:Uncharacterized protein n=1 Tax=Lentinus tigrinus ALCF2SS1-6 TaxID=1328759 RepID=A0A5C2RL21_9APHY|nr:hypothetical protein L227DRAFT_568719 [Lentinus tigrinus ALCF2SS1-6]RPD72621.1 hypothetical protein L226DRAFT_524652 [Lentinus tigrinus ALCF2SS1-7]
MMHLDVTSTLLGCLPPPICGDLAVSIELRVDTWTSPNRLAYRTYAARIVPDEHNQRSNPNTTVPTSSELSSLTPIMIHTPLLAALMAWLHALSRDTLIAINTPPQYRDAILKFGSLYMHLRRQSQPRREHWQRLRMSPGEVTAEEIAGLATWVRSHQPNPSCRTLDASAHGMSPADAITSSLVPPSDTYSSGILPTSSHVNPSTPADALQMTPLVQHKDVPENVTTDNDVSEMPDFNAIPDTSDASAHGVSPASAIASSLVLPCDMYSSSMSRTSSHGDLFTPADALQMMSLVQDKDTPGNVDSNNDPDVHLSTYSGISGN